MSNEEGGHESSVSELSDFEKGQIVGACLGGMSVDDVSRMFNVTCQTVSEVLNLYKLYVSPGLKRRAAPKTRKR